MKSKIKNVRKNLFKDLKEHREDLKMLQRSDDDVTGRITPMSNIKARINFQSYLPWWELEEMLEFPEIFFVGVNSSKIIYDPYDVTLNFGFDEWENEEAREADDEKMLIISPGDHIAYRYEVLKILGSGSYGRVIFARDHSRHSDDVNHEVALKILHNEPQMWKYFEKEVRILNYIRSKISEPERISRHLRSFFFRNHYVIVFELLGQSMFRGLSDSIKDLKMIGKYLESILIPLNNLHQIDLIHGDLKPENVMFQFGCFGLNCSNGLKLADFNLACSSASNMFPCPGVYFQTRHYRAPEVILDLNYTTKADMWSLGVMTSEMFLGSLPFYGETTIDQLAAIMEVLGLIPIEMIKHSPKIHIYQKAVNYRCKNGFQRRPFRKPLDGVLLGAPSLLVDFIRKCLKLDPDERMTSYEALQHPLVTGR